MNTGGYSLKNMKRCNGREGIAWSATLYLNGKKLGPVGDDGNGGAVRTWHLPRDAEANLQAFAATLPPVTEYGTELKMDAGLFLSALGDYQDSVKKLARELTKNIVFVCSDGDVRCLPIALGVERIRADVARRYPGATILNDLPDAVDRFHSALEARLAVMEARNHG